MNKRKTIYEVFTNNLKNNLDNNSNNKIVKKKKRLIHFTYSRRKKKTNYRKFETRFFHLSKSRPINLSQAQRKNRVEGGQKDWSIPDFVPGKPTKNPSFHFHVSGIRTPDGKQESRWIRVTCETNTWKIPFYSYTHGGYRTYNVRTSP